MSKRPTLADVAKAANVSVTTASLALNGKATDKIPLATRKRVHAAAETLNFRPNGVARALVRQRADVLGVVCTLNPFVELAHHSFEQALLSALFYHALEVGYNPMIYGVPPADAEDNLFPRYADGRSDAFVLLYPPPTSLLLTRLPQLGIPVVSVCCRVEGVRWVDSDHESGIQNALDHLIALGHRRIAYLTGPDDGDNRSTRGVNFRQALQEHGLPVNEAWILPYATESVSTEDQVARLCAGPEPPTALIAWNDYAAEEVYKALRARGVCIPEEMSVVGFDDIPSSRVAVPPLTTIRQDVVRMGRAAVDLALGALSETPEITTVVCPVELVVRQSTAPPRRKSAL